MMKTLIIIAVLLVSLFWITDGNEGFASLKRSKLRRAFFSKRAFSLGYAENIKYNCIKTLCLPDPDECSDDTRNQCQHIADGEKMDVQDTESLLRFIVCATTCLKNGHNFWQE